MKATKKIVGAACALVAAVALSAGSTFAWFATNSHVEVSAMKVQSTVPTGLLNIVGGHVYDITAINSTVLESSSPAGVYYPVRIEKDSDTTFTKLVLKNAPALDSTDGWDTKPSSDNAGAVAEGKYVAVTANGTGAGEIDHTTINTTSTDATKINYAFVEPMSLVNKGEATKSIKLNAVVTVERNETATGEDKTLDFLKCGFLISDGESSADAGTLTWKYMATSDSFSSSNTWTQNNLIEMENNKAYQINFVIWYDGDDTDCTTDNALNPSEYTFSIAYTVAEAETEASGG